MQVYQAELRGSTSIEVLQGHTAAVLDVAWSRDGRLLASAAADGVVIVWRAFGAAQWSKLRGAQQAVTGLALALKGYPEV